jgi:hypothetical protein
MDDHTIYVRMTNERWAVSVDPYAAGNRYPDRATALAAARRACRHKWEIEGRPCVVRVRGDNGLWEDADLFGNAWG